MRGTTTIELTNVKTGEKEIIKHDNMITNAVRDVLQLNPFGVGYRSSSFSDILFPIAGKLIGGIQLFAEPLEENADKYFAPYDNPVIGYASMDVNTGTDNRRGSLNQIESGELPDGQGYRFVWDFATSQGNGVISSLGLCDEGGGQGSAGGEYQLNTELARLYKGALAKNPSIEILKALSSIIYLSPEENFGYSVFWESSKVIRIKKVNLPITSFGLSNDVSVKPDIDIEDIATINPDAFGYASSSPAYLSFCYDDSGYVWGFQHDGNADGNSSGNANVRWVKIDASDWSYEEGMWSVDAHIYRFGNKSLNSYENRTCCLVHHGSLYCRAYNGYGIYRINLSNPTDIIILPEAGRGSGTHAYIRLPDEKYYYSSTLFNVIGDTIIFPGGHIVDDVVHCRDASVDATYGRSYGAYPKLQYGPFLFTFASYYYYSGLSSEVPYANIEIDLIRTYLATINNLPQTVEKTADKTMKVTYTLYETDDAPQDP